jgi:hypothetical protein
MAGLSLDDLPMPRRRYRIDRISSSKFETEGAAQKEDMTRARMLRSCLGRSTFEQRTYNRLAARIEEIDPEKHTTIASAVVMHTHRIKIVGGLWPLCSGNETYLVTLMARDYSVTPDELMNVNPVDCNQWLRTTLARCGAKSETYGWIFAYLEGEYNSATGMIQLHWHLIVTHSQMRAVIERLRGHSAFKRMVGANNNPDGIDMRIVVQPVPEEDLPNAISYAVKGGWYAKWRSEDDGGNRQTARCKGRIPEPARSKVLLWLDRWRVQNMAMMLNLYVGKNGITAR